MERKTQPKAQEKAVVQWKGEAITITFHDVVDLICPLATGKEVAVFLKTCQSLQLNPFAKEIYLIKYSDRDKAAMVIAIESYLKAAEANENYNGSEAGIILKESPGKLEFREGAFLLEEEMDKLVGGWARVYRKNRDRPAYMAVNIKECLRYTKEGRLTQFWTKEKQASMLRKTALKRALVEAFPSLFAGTMSTAEVAEVPEGEYEEMPEGELPPAYEREGEAYWKKWWARQKEKGLDEEKVHNILQIESLKTDWLEQGRTLEEAEEIINKALEQRVNYQPVTTDMPHAATEQAFTPPEVKPKQVDWRAFWEHTEQLGLSRDRVCEMLGVTSVKEWTDQGKTLDEAVKIISEKLAEPMATSEGGGEIDATPGEGGGQPGTAILSPPKSKIKNSESAPPAEPEGEGFHINLDWLKESLNQLKWSEDTAKTFLVSQYKVSPTGILEEVLNNLTREQAEEFVKTIQEKVQQRQMELL